MEMWIPSKNSKRVTIGIQQFTTITYRIQLPPVRLHTQQRKLHPFINLFLHMSQVSQFDNTISRLKSFRFYPISVIYNIGL